MRSFLSRGYLWRGKTAPKTLKWRRFYLKDTRKHDFIYSTMVRFEHMHKTGHHYGTLAHTKNTFQQFLLHTRYSNCKNRVKTSSMVLPCKKKIARFHHEVWQKEYGNTMERFLKSVQWISVHAIPLSKAENMLKCTHWWGKAVQTRFCCCSWTCSSWWCEPAPELAAARISARDQTEARETCPPHLRWTERIWKARALFGLLSPLETGEVQLVKFQRSAFDSGFDSQRDWPGPALLHAHVTPSAPHYIE